MVWNNFIISGPLSSFLSTRSGNLIVNVTWILKAQKGKLSLFNGFMQLVPINLTKLWHPHSFVNFRSNPNSQNVMLGPDRTC